MNKASFPIDSIISKSVSKHVNDCIEYPCEYNSQDYPMIQRAEMESYPSRTSIRVAVANNNILNERVTMSSTAHTLDSLPLKPRRRSSLKSNPESFSKLMDGCTVASTSVASDVTNPSPVISLQTEADDIESMTSFDDDQSMISFFETDEDVPQEDYPLHFAKQNPDERNDAPPTRLSLRQNSETIRQAQTRTIYLERSPPDSNVDLPPLCPKPSPSLVSVAPMDALRKLANVFVARCPVGSHSYRLKKYENAFVGSEAVDFMLKEELVSTREDAVFLGQRFCKEMNLFHHVRWHHPFKDGYYFYQFTDMAIYDIPHVSVELLKTIAESLADDMIVSSHSTIFGTYKNSFLGSEAVDHMIDNGFAANREFAVFLGQRLADELLLFYHVTHGPRFQDGLQLYRFTNEDEVAASGDDDSISIASLMSSLSTMFRKKSAKDSSTDSLCCSFQTTTTVSSICKSRSDSLHDRRSLQMVSFGKKQERIFERSLALNPATSSGPSIGLGWKYYDSPAILIREFTTSRRSHDLRLSSDSRNQILKEWGHSMVEINKAARANKKIRKQRRKTMNKLTVGTKFDTK